MKLSVILVLLTLSVVVKGQLLFWTVLAQPLLLGFSAVLCTLDIPNFLDPEPAVWGKWKINKNE